MIRRRIAAPEAVDEAHPDWAARTHMASLLLTGAFLLALASQQWFWSDDFGVLSLRHDPLSGLIQPNGYHWLLSSTLIHEALYAVFGLHTYLPFLSVSIAFHLLLAYLLRRTIIRAGVPPWTATAGVIPFLLMGAGFRTLLWSETLSGPLVICLGLLLLEINDTAVLSRGRARMSMLLSLLVVTSAGELLLIFAGAIIWRRRGFRAAVRQVVPGMLLYLIWVVVYGAAGLSNPGFVHSDLLTAFPDFVWSGLVGAMDALTVIPILGALAVVLLFGWMIRSHTWLFETGRAPALATAGAALAFMGAVGVGRLNGGVPWTSYYVYPIVALLLPAIAVGWTELANRIPFGRVVVAGVPLVSAVHGGWLLSTQAADWGVLRQETRTAIEVAAWSDDASALGDAEVDPTGEPGLTLSTVRAARVDGSVSRPPDGSDRLRRIEASRLHVALLVQRPASRPDESPARVNGVAAVSCTLLLGTSGGAGAQITTAGMSVLRIETRVPTFPDVTVSDGMDPADNLSPRGIAPGSPTYLVVSGADVVVNVRTSGSDIVLCPVSR